ncbi:hypothetical protein ABMA79_07690 [Halobacteriovorax sp. HFRX-2_2]|uniref:hypothetical protein n=1 Tax=unclassified Halobacteriovorax TaxID=2639665 RepID=UPI0037116414
MIDKYYLMVLDELKSITQQSLDQLGNKSSIPNHYSDLMYYLETNTTDPIEKNMIKNAAHQLQLSNICLLSGLYRQAFSSLRLTFEISLGSIFLSLFKLDQLAWVNNKHDISWSRMTSEEDGLFSKKFIELHSPGIEAERDRLFKKANKTYRELSEYVHGNNKTWTTKDPALKLNLTEIDSYYTLTESVAEIFITTWFIKNYKEIDSDNFEYEKFQEFPKIKEYFKH